MSDATTAASTSSTTHLGGDTTTGATTAATSTQTATTGASTTTTTAADTTTATTTPPATTTTDGKPAPDAKPDDKGTKEGDKPTGAPEAYEPFKLPEGVQLDDSLVTELQAVAKELNLPQEAAQKLADLAASRQAKSVEAMQAAVEKQGEVWAEEAKVDKEFGGDKFDENLAVAKRALDQFGTPELKNLLNSSKFGNHPEVLRTFFRIGKAISEDGFVPNRQGGSTGGSIAQRMYPNMNP